MKTEDITKSDRNLGKMNKKEWKQKLKSFNEEWKTALKPYKGKIPCLHHYVEPSSIKLPPTRINATIVYTNGASEKVFSAVWKYTYNKYDLKIISKTKEVTQCSKCGRLRFYDDPYK